MVVRIEKNLVSSDGSKIATELSLHKTYGTLSRMIRVNTNDSSSTDEINEIQKNPEDSDISINQLLFPGNDAIAIYVVNSVYIESLSLEIISPYSTESKLCIYTTTGFYKSFSIGEKTGNVVIDLMENETPSGEDFITSNGFPTVNTEEGYRPKFINFQSYQNPIELIFRIVGNDKSTASAVIKCVIKAC